MFIPTHRRIHQFIVHVYSHTTPHTYMLLYHFSCTGHARGSCLYGWLPEYAPISSPCVALIKSNLSYFCERGELRYLSFRKPGCRITLVAAIPPALLSYSALALSTTLGIRQFTEGKVEEGSISSEIRGISSNGMGEAPSVL